jgi:agmatine deiminase
LPFGIAQHNKQVQKMLRARGVNLKRVHFQIWDYADVWFRDYGPTFVVQRQKSEIAIVQWQFSAVGRQVTNR